MALPVGAGPSGPGVVHRGGLFHEPEQAFQAPVQQAAGSAVGAERTRQAGDAGGGFARLGNGRIYEQHRAIMRDELRNEWIALFYEQLICWPRTLVSSASPAVSCPQS